MTPAKLLKPVYLVASLAAGLPSSHALLDTGTGALYLDATASVTYDSNVFTNSLDLGDTIYRLTPTLLYIQDRGLVHMTASAATTFNEYDDFSAQSGEDYFLNVAFTGLHRSPDPAGDFSFAASYADQTIASEEIATRIDVTNIDLSGSFTLDLSEKTRLRLSGAWADRDYKEGAFSDSEDSSARADLLYTYSEKLSTRAGYRYREIAYTDDALDNQEDSFIVGAEGVFTPKLSGSVEIGASDGDRYDGTRLYYSVGLDWAVDDNTSASLSGNRDTTPSALGADATSTRLTFSLAQRFTNRITGTASIGLGRFEREGTLPRDDDILYAGAGLSMPVGTNGSLFASLDFQDRDSNSVDSDYDRFLFSVGGRLRF